MSLPLFRVMLLAVAAVAAIASFATTADAARRRVKPGIKAAAQQSRPILPISDTYAVGSIVVVNAERRLYYVHAKGQAMIYPVAIGKPAERWTGNLFVQSKAVNPSWTKPESGVRMPGGPGNPLGVRALYLGWTLYRIHGTNSPGSIGSAASNGCFRMFNEHVADLYQRVHVGAPVYVMETLQDAPVAPELSASKNIWKKKARLATVQP